MHAKIFKEKCMNVWSLLWNISKFLFHINRAKICDMIWDKTKRVKPKIESWWWLPVDAYYEIPLLFYKLT
jgi:hypothetical protein